MRKIYISTSNYFDDELHPYRDKIQSKYVLKTDSSAAYIETDDTIGKVVEFFIDNVYPRIVVGKDDDAELSVTIYDGYIE